MKTKDLMIRIKNELEAKGFEVESAHFSNLGEYEHQASATKDGKSERRPVEGYNFTHLFGYEIGFQVVHRSNATEENISVDLVVYEWKNSSGKRLAKERLNTNMGETAIMKRINKIIDFYEAL